MTHTDLRNRFKVTGQTARDFIRWAASNGVTVHDATVSRHLSGTQGITEPWKLAYLFFFSHNNSFHMAQIDSIMQEIFEHLSPMEVFVKYSRSGSAYIDVEYHERPTSTKVLKIRVSDHQHPSGFNGIDLVGSDAENVSNLKKVFGVKFPKPQIMRR